MQYLKYVIYQIDEKGMLERPTKTSLWGKVIKFDPFDSMEEAYNALPCFETFIILPVVFKE
ncbi:MAG: hypothetical protein PVF17_00095 [Ignavibacteria bacterium]|jgi:hypothetical protein